MKKLIEVQYYKDAQFNQIKEKKDLSWPQTYEDFIQDIIKNFQLKKNSKIILQLITEDEDDVTINSQEGINDYQKDNNIKEFKFCLENNEDTEDSNSEEDWEEGNVIIFDDFKIEEINVDEIMKDIFDTEKYKQNLEANSENYSNIFKTNLEKNVDIMLIATKEKMENELNLKLSNFSNMYFEAEKEIKNTILNLQDSINNIKDGADEMSLGIEQLQDGIDKNEIFISHVIIPDPKPKPIPKPNPDDDILREEKNKKANVMFEEIKNKYLNYENLINKDEIINKLLNNNLNKDEITNEIKAKIKEIKEKEEKEKQNKAEEIYNKLNINNINIEKKEIIDYIIQNNFDKETVQNWINNKIEEQNKANAENIYNKLSQLNDVDFSKSNKDDIIKKIIELNFNEDEIKNIYKKEVEPEPKPVPMPKPVPQEVIDIFNELEDSYGITSFLDEGAVKDKIIELNCDREKIEEWVSEIVANGV